MAPSVNRSAGTCYLEETKKISVLIIEFVPSCELEDYLTTGVFGKLRG